MLREYSKRALNPNFQTPDFGPKVALVGSGTDGEWGVVSIGKFQGFGMIKLLKLYPWAE